MTPKVQSFERVRKWALKVGIMAKATQRSQYEKFLEEVNEVSCALIDGHGLKQEIGDVIVTCILLSEFSGFSAEDALQSAIDKIEKRRGEMINGKFVKSEYVQA